MIIARGDQIRHFTIRPWVAAFAGAVIAAFAIGYLLATSYLVLRDDLLGATSARQARIQQSYEDRISALRAQVDRITSRQLLDQQLMEGKVSELLERQAQLSQRHGRLGPILERLRGEDEGLPGAAPLPEQRPEQRASATTIPAPADLLSAFWGPSKGGGETAADRADRLFVTINQSLRVIEEEQIGRIEDLAESAFQTADQIAEVLESVGLPLRFEDDAEAAGGPLLPVDDFLEFEARVRELDAALEKLELAKEAARVLPIHNPAPGFAVSSSFGVRRDPLLGTPAMHSGTDFRTPTGTPIRASGAGTVITAGWNGGYGRMVEIEHEHGITTRYAHMSRIRVSVGERVETGQTVGLAGSTGRSTGPHLHYEVRRHGKAIDPVRFLKAGRQITGLL